MQSCFVFSAFLVMKVKIKWIDQQCVSKALAINDNDNFKTKMLYSCKIICCSYTSLCDNIMMRYK